MTPAQTRAMALVREADPDRYISALYAPQEKRGHLFALYAFNAEIAAVRDRVSDPLPGEVRLQWWRDALKAGGDPAAAQGNPLAEALLETIGTHRLPVSSLLAYLDARLFDLYDDPMPGRTELEGYCGETASAVIQLASIILVGDEAVQTATLAGHAGCAQAIAGLLRLLPIHRARGQCYVPADILAATGSSRDELVAGEGEGASHAVAAMIALGREHLSAFESEARRLSSRIRPAFLPVAPVGAYLRRLQNSNIDPLTQVADIPAAKRHWLILRRAVEGWR